jgi:autoinducer 2-degrading protein
MYVITVQFTIDSRHTGSFMPLILENARASRETERGCRHFDVCRDPAKPDSVFLYEVYDSRAAFEEHVKSMHFQSFDQATSGMVAGKQVHVYERVNP